MRPLLLFLMMDTVYSQVYIPKDSARERKSLLGSFQVTNQAACELACNCARGNASALDCAPFAGVIQPMNCQIYYYTASFCSFLGHYTVNTCMLPIVEHHLEQKSTTTIQTASTTSTTTKPTTTTTTPPTTTTTTLEVALNNPTTTTTPTPTTTTTTAELTTITTTTATTTATPAETTTNAAAACPYEGVWSEWTTTGDCATTCGSFSTAARKRTCEKCGGCGECVGLSEDEGPCGIALCSFPTCAAPYKRNYNQVTKQWFCGLGEVPVNQPCP